MFFSKFTLDFIVGDSSLNRNPDFLYTLFVPDRARTAFPVFDQPNLKATYDLTLTVPLHWQAMSNAALAEQTVQGERKRLRFATSDLISTYLFSFVAGEFEAITRVVDGREMTMLHRESDVAKVQRNVDAIFELHGAALDWLEAYTGIDYPFQKFDFALIPSFQYGGMEHVGAIQYRADSLLLDESPSQNRLLSRASLISHETAHMWFGDLVTMDWFNDVWTKEVFANFMAAKIVNPGFPDIDHALSFLLRHYPSAYEVDRSEGANPIRQELANLNQAGTLYGNIIYNKAPIMMRQLETLVGEQAFQQGMRDYLQTYRLGNATWPDLVAILDGLTEQDLVGWSEIWVNTSGRPHFEAPGGTQGGSLLQQDPRQRGRVWPQQFAIATFSEGEVANHAVNSVSPLVTYASVPGDIRPSALLFNADGMGYGLFPADPGLLALWDSLAPVQKGSLLISLFDNLLQGEGMAPAAYLGELLARLPDEQNQLLLNLMLGQMERIYWSFLSDAERASVHPSLEQQLWNGVNDRSDSSDKKMFFDSFHDVALSASAVNRLYGLWSRQESVEGLNLAETDFIDLAVTLSIHRPAQSATILAQQLERTESPDRKRRLQWISPALSAQQAERDEFFAGLQMASNREIESWVLAALGALHHPLRRSESEQYLGPSLELLEEIQATGDIFFPARWLSVSLGGYNSASAVETVRGFLADRPDYNPQLRMKILQAADRLFRAERILRQ